MIYRLWYKLRSHTAQAHIPASLTSSCILLGKLLNPSVLRLPHLCSEGKNNIDLTETVEGPDYLTNIKCLEQCPEYSKFHIKM